MKLSEFNNKTIFDLGFHKGEDSLYYLAKGFRVVGVEADPHLYTQGLYTFDEALQSGRLILHHAAVVGSRRPEKVVMFHPHPLRSEWGSIDARWIARNTIKHGQPHSDAIAVPTITLPDLVSVYGHPYYLKIDIEGSDEEVLADVKQLSKAPYFVSWECGKHSLYDVFRQHKMMFTSGYKYFRIIQQAYQERKSELIPETGEIFQFLPGSTGALPLQDVNKYQHYYIILMRWFFLFIVYRLIGPGTLFQRASKSHHKWVSILPHKLKEWADRHHIPFPGWHDSQALHFSFFEKKSICTLNHKIIRK